MTTLILLTSTALATAILWPAIIGSGILAHRDLLLMPWIEAPRSIFWLGPDLGRRLPTFGFLSFVSEIAGGRFASRAMFIMTLIGLSLGMNSLVRSVMSEASTNSVSYGRSSTWLTTVAGVTAGCAAIVSPFTLTRLSIGHLTTFWAIAVLPFLYLAILNDRRDVARSRACSVAALLGVVAGIYALIVLLTVVLPALRSSSELGGRWAVGSFASWLIRHSVWLLPGVFLQSHGYSTFTDPTVFEPTFRSASQVLGIVVGRGYWDADAEALRGSDTVVALVAVLLISLAALGWGRLPGVLRSPIAGSMIIGYGVPIFAATPLTKPLYRTFVSTPLGVALREPHRLVGLGVVPLILLATLGVAVLSDLMANVTRRRFGVWIFLVLVIPLGSLGLKSVSTIHDRLTPLETPTAWKLARSVVARNGGTVLALPWSEYVILEIDRERLVYNPLADLFGPDTLVSSDPSMGEPVNEAADARAETAAEVAQDLQEGTFPIGELRDLRVRWIAVLKVEDVKTLSLERSGMTRKVMTSPSLDLYQVLGDFQVTKRPFPFLVSGARSDVDVPWTWGWVDSVPVLGSRSPVGLLRGTGLMVYLPAFLGMGLLGTTIYFSVRPPRRRPADL